MILCRKTYLLSGLLPAVCLFGLLLSPLPAQAGDPLGFTGNWNYRKTGGDAGSSSQFSHSYTLNYNKQLSQYMTLSGSLRYNENLPSEGAATDSITPSLSVDTRNDLFFLGLSASQNQVNREGAPSTTDNSWGTTFFTLNDEWPLLRAYFNQSHNYDDGSPRRADTESTDYGGSLDYEWTDFTLLYDFRSSVTDDQLDGSSTENIEHLAQLKYARSFFDDTLAVNASQQYRENQNTIESAGGEFLLPVSILSASSGADDTPANSSLASNSSLTDGDEVNSAGIDITTSSVRQNIAAEVNFQPVDRFRLFLDQQLSTSLQGLLSWQVWVSNDGIGWTQVPNIPAVYRLEHNRTVVIIDLLSVTNSRYVKAVSDIGIVSATSVFVTEIEAGEIRTSTASRVSIRTNYISQQTEVGLNYRPNEAWRFGYNARRVTNEQDRGANTVQLNQSISVGYIAAEWLEFAFGVTENLDQVDGSADRKTRSYAASMNAQLLRTLDFSLGYTRTENDSGNGRDTNSDAVNAVFNATIYPDLTASLNNRWSRSQNANGGETTTIGMTLNSTARLSPKLDMNFNASYVENSTDGPIDETSISDSATRYGLSANYRPSDILQLSGSLSRDEDSDQNSMAGNATFLASRKLQALFGFAYEFGEQQSQFYNSTISWLLTQNLSWQSTGNFVASEGGDSWALSSTVNANF